MMTERDQPSAAERRRYHLHDQAVAAMDAEAADTLLDHLPPAGWHWTDLATKHDLHQTETTLRTEIEHGLAMVHQRIDHLEQRLAANEERFIERLAATEARIGAMLHDALAKQGWRYTVATLTTVVGVSVLPVVLERYL